MATYSIHVYNEQATPTKFRARSCAEKSALKSDICIKHGLEKVTNPFVELFQRTNWRFVTIYDDTTIVFYITMYHDSPPKSPT